MLISLPAALTAKLMVVLSGMVMNSRARLGASALAVSASRSWLSSATGRRQVLLGMLGAPAQVGAGFLEDLGAGAF